METRKAIETRRSVRAWTSAEVSNDVVEQVLQAGRASPSPLNSQPWRFIVVRDRETLKILSMTAQHAPFLAHANVLVVVTVDKRAKVDEWLSEHEQHVYSGACALHNMSLAAWDLGVGGCWVTTDEETTRNALNIPEEHILIGGLAFGYPLGHPQPHTEKDRRPLAETVFSERFGRTQ